jgi:hypothetical protein
MVSGNIDAFTASAEASDRDLYWRICFKGRKVNLSHVFAGQNVGVRQVSDRIWLVSFMDYDLG